MERLTKRDKVQLSHGEEIVICKHDNADCNDSCMKIRSCRWYEKAMNKLHRYENLEEQCVKDNLFGLHELCDKWKAFYEDIVELLDYRKKKEQGLLIELPCPVGTVIYIVNRYWHSVELGNICGISECDDVDCFCYKVYVDPDTYENIAISEFGKEWFLTEAEAEEALAKMGE